MNYLAHILLSGSHPQRKLGGFLGDFIKGPISPTPLDAVGEPWPAMVLEGVVLHRQLDAYIDALPQYRACIALLGEEYRRVGGIAMDVFVDHILVRHWSQFCEQPLREFCADFYHLCDQHRQQLPDSAERFIRRASERELFQRYGDQQVFLQVLESIDRRIRYETNLIGAGEAIASRHQELEGRLLEVLEYMIGAARGMRAAARQ